MIHWVNLCEEVFLFVFLINLFIYFWLHWVFVAVRGLSLVAESGGSSSLRCAGFSLRWLLLLRSMGSRHAGFSSCGSRALEHRLSSCGARAWLLRGMWELTGGFLTTVSPGKSQKSPYWKHSSKVYAFVVWKKEMRWGGGMKNDAFDLVLEVGNVDDHCCSGR